MTEFGSVVIEGGLCRLLSRLPDPTYHVTAMKSPRVFIALLMAQWLRAMTAILSSIPSNHMVVRSDASSGLKRITVCSHTFNKSFKDSNNKCF